jgi:HEAT repeat protein
LPAIQPLRRLLPQADPKLRLAVIQALGKMGPAALPALNDLLAVCETSNLAVQTRAETSLGQMGIAALPSLRQALRSKSARIRKSAAAALAGMSTNAASTVPDLIPLLLDDALEVRTASAATLGSIGSTARPALSELLANCAHQPPLRWVAAQAIWSIIRYQADFPLEIIHGLDSPDPDVQTLVLRIFTSRRGPTDSLPKILELSAHQNPEVRAAALQALARLWHATKPIAGIEEPAPENEGLNVASRRQTNSTDILNVFLTALGDGDSTVRQTAINAIRDVAQRLVRLESGSQAIVADGYLGFISRAVQVLTQMLQDSDLQTVQSAAYGLGGCGRHALPAAPALIELLGDENPENADAFIGPLGMIGPAVIPLILTDFKKRSPPMRARLVKALGVIGPDAVPSLIGLFKFDEPYLRSSVLVALANTGLAGLPAVMEGLKDKHPRVRHTTLTVLRTAGSSSVMRGSLWVSPQPGPISPEFIAELIPAVPLVTDLLEDSDSEVRAAAADLLAALGSAAIPAKDALLTASQDPVEAVRLSATAALEALRSPSGSSSE